MIKIGNCEVRWRSLNIDVRIIFMLVHEEKGALLFLW